MEAVSLKASTGDSYPALNPIDLIPFVTYTERIETAPYRLHILHLQDCIQRFIFPARLPTWQLRKFPLKVRYFSSSKRLRRICLRFDSFIMLPAKHSPATLKRKASTPRPPRIASDRLPVLYRALTDQVDDGYFHNAISTCKKSELLRQSKIRVTSPAIFERGS